LPDFTLPTNSLNSSAGKSFRATNAIGDSAIIPIGSKSLIAS
jgi:hypothetical protein